MKIEEFAHLILFGKSLADKLVQPSTDLRSVPASPIEIPDFPGRPPELSKLGKSVFPSVHQLSDPLERAKVLHFFANHELLAMELMALVLLRFPEAPLQFRLGVARTIQEEQNHLRLYISRMKELGIEFGDLPVNNYFWTSMKGVGSPLDFTVQMSLTFEQANLDFSLFFMNAVQAVGDQKTGLLLERVFREEIGHVKHGLLWFNRWRENSSTQSDWEGYLKLLSPPLTPQRAKGFHFCETARREAGLSEMFIRELRVHSGSKGRPPVLWFYNPHCESEIARGRPGYCPSEGARKISRDLEKIPMFLCLSQDAVLVQERPRTEWLEYLLENGFEIPEFIEVKVPLIQSDLELKIAPKISGMQPWGWSADILNAFRPICNRLVEADGGNSKFCRDISHYEDFEQTGLGKLYSKSWSVKFLADWLESHPSQQDFCDLRVVGTSYSDWGPASLRIQQSLTEGDVMMVKAPYGTSGMQVRVIRKVDELSGSIGGWIKNTLSHQGAVIIEPFLNKTVDLSIQMNVQAHRTELLEVRQFMTGPHHEYRGTYLGHFGKKMLGLAPADSKFFYSILPLWKEFLRDLGARLRAEGYLGPAGVDAFLWKDKSGALRFKPLVELNPRWTMGRVALELEKHLVPGTSAHWKFISLREVKKMGFESAEEFARDLKQKHPVKTLRVGDRLRIASGVVFTNDPKQVQGVITFLETIAHSR